MGKSIAERSMARLRDCGYVQAEIKPKARTAYRLTARQFGVNLPVDEDLEGIEQKSCNKITDSRPIKICPLCHKKRRGMMKVGWCRTCNTDKRMRKVARDVVREEAAKSA